MLKNFLPFLLLLSLHSAQGAGIKAPPGKAKLGDNADLAALAQKAKAPVPDLLEIQQEQALDQAVAQRRQERYQERLEAKREQDLTALVEAGRPTLAAPAPTTEPAADEAAGDASVYTPRTLENRAPKSEIDAIIAERQAAREAQSSGGATSESEDTATSDDESAGSEGSDGAGTGTDTRGGAGAGAGTYPRAARGKQQRQGAHAQTKRGGPSRKEHRKPLLRRTAQASQAVDAVDPAEIARASEERRLTQLPPDQREAMLKARLFAASRPRLTQGLPHLHAPTLQRLLDRERELRHIQEERERVEREKLAERVERKRRKDLERQQKRQEALEREIGQEALERKELEREQALIQSAIEAETKANEKAARALRAGLDAKDAEIPRAYGDAFGLLDFLASQEEAVKQADAEGRASLDSGSMAPDGMSGGSKAQQGE